MNVTRMLTLEAHDVQLYVWTKSIPLVPLVTEILWNVVSVTCIS